MPAGIADLALDQGSTFGFTLRIWTDQTKASRRDLSGFSARMQIRSFTGSGTPIWSSASFAGSVSIPSPTSGEIIVRIEAAQSKDFPSGKCHYDVEIFTASDAQVEKVVRGTLTVIPEVTR